MRADQAESARRGRAGGRQRAAAAGCLWPTEHESVRPFFSFFFFFFFQLVLTLLLFLTIYLKLPRAGDMSLFFLPSLHICTLQHLIHSTEYSTHTHTRSPESIHQNEFVLLCLTHTHTVLLLLLLLHIVSPCTIILGSLSEEICCAFKRFVLCCATSSSQRVNWAEPSVSFRSARLTALFIRRIKYTSSSTEYLQDLSVICVTGPTFPRESGIPP